MHAEPEVRSGKKAASKRGARSLGVLFGRQSGVGDPQPRRLALCRVRAAGAPGGPAQASS